MKPELCSACDGKGYHVLRNGGSDLEGENIDPSEREQCQDCFGSGQIMTLTPEEVISEIRRVAQEKANAVYQSSKMQVPEHFFIEINWSEPPYETENDSYRIHLDSSDFTTYAKKEQTL